MPLEDVEVCSYCDWSRVGIKKIRKEKSNG